MEEAAPPLDSRRRARRGCVVMGNGRHCVGRMGKTLGGRSIFWCFPPTPDLGSCWSKCLSFNSFHPTCVEVGHQTGHVLGTGAQRWRRGAPALLGTVGIDHVLQNSKELLRAVGQRKGKSSS